MSFVPGRSPGADDPDRRGYTLIEVLVAMVLFSSMALLAVTALNQSLRQYQALLDRGLGFWGHAQRIWTDKSFHSMVDYYVRGAPYGWFPYFRGDQEGVSFVTLTPLAGDLPVVVWIRKEASEGGKWGLTYYELPVYVKSYGEIQADFVSGAYRRGPSIKLLDGAEQIEFQYYGYSEQDEKHLWRNSFDGFQTKTLPLLVRVVFTREGVARELMYGVHVNSRLKMGYNEKYKQ